MKALIQARPALMTTYHTQETGRFSGTTVWAGMRFGVQGRRARPAEVRVKKLVPVVHRPVL